MITYTVGLKLAKRTKALTIEAEDALLDRPATREVFQAAANVALAGARAHGENGFKIPLAKRTLVRALEIVADTP